MAADVVALAGEEGLLFILLLWLLCASVGISLCSVLSCGFCLIVGLLHFGWHLWCTSSSGVVRSECGRWYRISAQPPVEMVSHQSGLQWRAWWHLQERVCCLLGVIPGAVVVLFACYLLVCSCAVRIFFAWRQLGRQNNLPVSAKRHPLALLD
jgi:hypothetical protein